MDYRLTPQDEEFRKRFREWLSKNFKGDKALPSTATLEERVAIYRESQKKLFGAGYAGIQYDPKYGGRGGSIIREYSNSVPP